jgi:hypothetical protein
MAGSGLAFGRAATAGAHDEALGGYVVEDQVGFLLRRAHQRHTVLFQDGIGDADLTPTQFTALIKVVELGRVTQNHLGRLAAMDAIRRTVPCARAVTEATLQPLDAEERARLIALLRKLA